MKKKIVWIIIAAVLVLGIVGGGIYFYYYKIASADTAGNFTIDALKLVSDTYYNCRNSNPSQECTPQYDCFAEVSWTKDKNNFYLRLFFEKRSYTERVKYKFFGDDKESCAAKLTDDLKETKFYKYDSKRRKFNELNSDPAPKGGGYGMIAGGQRGYIRGDYIKIGDYCCPVNPTPTPTPSATISPTSTRTPTPSPTNTYSPIPTTPRP